MKGTCYAQNELRFMLIGRAPNGWESLNAQNGEAFGNEAEQLFNTDRWNWIEVINGTQYSTHDKDQSDLKNRYCIDKKPFWTFSKAIWEKLSGQSSTNLIWQKNIVWSNLYKVSPKNSDNPSWHSQQMQQQVCMDILKKELDVYQPTHVLVVSGFDWFEPFASIFEKVQDTGVRNILRGESKNEVCVEGKATYNNAKVVIACRPEWRNKEAYVEEVAEAFCNGF
jgi:hypothetical protein